MIVKGWEWKGKPEKVARMTVEEIESVELQQGVINCLEAHKIGITGIGVDMGTGLRHVDFRKSPSKMAATGLLIEESRQESLSGATEIVSYRFAKKIEPVEVAF